MKLTQKNYFSPEANKEYMSVSQFKAFDKCQYSALAEINGEYEREKTTSLLVGSYVDSYFEGELNTFKQENPAIFTQKGALRAEFTQAEAIIERIKKDRLFMQYLSGLKQVIMTGTINGVDVKIKVDSLLPDKIVDLKIMKDFESVYDAVSGSIPWWAGWGYDLQGAVYREIVYQNTGKKLPFYIVAATKEKVTDIDCIEIEEKDLDFALERFSANVPMFDAIKKGIIEPERCEKCDFCKITKVLEEPKKSSEFYF